MLPIGLLERSDGPEAMEPVASTSGHPPSSPLGPAPAVSPAGSPWSTKGRVTYSDRFIPSRAAAARLDFSILDREHVTSEVNKSAADREVRRRVGQGKGASGAWALHARTRPRHVNSIVVPPRARSGGPCCSSWAARPLTQERAQRSRAGARMLGTGCTTHARHRRPTPRGDRRT